MFEKSVAELGRALIAREVSAVELARLFLERIESHRNLNAFLDVRPEITLAQARAADARIGKGDATPLTGVPIAHKDIFVTRDFYSTASSRMLKGYMSPFDATVVERLKDAGMVTLGKLNCDEFAMGSSNENSHYGNVLNPWGQGCGTGRKFGWFRSGGRGENCPGGNGHRHRRIHSRAGGVLGRHRDQADLRPRVALGHDRVRLQPGPGRHHDPLGRGCGADLQRHARFRSEGFDQRRARP